MPDRARAHVVALLAECLGDRPVSLTGLPPRRPRIAASRRLHQRIQGLEPPLILGGHGLATCPVAAQTPRRPVDLAGRVHSCLPSQTVLSASPVARATVATPPCPRLCASVAAHKRRARSSHSGLRASYVALLACSCVGEIMRGV